MGRPWLSQMACSFVFMPPLFDQSGVHAPFFNAQAGRRAMGLQLGCVDHHGRLLAVLGRQSR